MKIIIRIFIKVLKCAVWALAFYIVVLFGMWLWCAQPVLIQPDQSPHHFNPSPDHLKQYVKNISEGYSPRSFTNTANLERLAVYIKNEFEKTANGVSIQNFSVTMPDYVRYPEKKENYINISALYGPETKERIVIGAHYDAFHTYPGADDNASGVAGLLELGQMLKTKKDLPIQVELAAYALEEPPFFETDQMGSAIHAKKLREKNINVRLMIVLEMIGYFSEQESSQNFPTFLMGLYYPTKGNFISVVGDLKNRSNVLKMKKAILSTGGIDVYSISAPAALPGIDFSDHRNYWIYEYPAVMITDTAFYRNPHYHTYKDTFEKLDYEKMAEVLKGVMTSIYQIGKVE